LSKKERQFIQAGSLIIFIILYLFLFLFPQREEIRRLDRVIVSHLKDLEEMRKLATTYIKWSKGVKRVDSQDKSLFTLLEELARRNRLEKKIEYIRPLPGEEEIERVEIKISQVTLKEVVSYLYYLENLSPSLYILELTLKETKTPGYLELEAKIEKS